MGATPTQPLPKLSANLCSHVLQPCRLTLRCPRQQYQRRASRDLECLLGRHPGSWEQQASLTRSVFHSWYSVQPEHVIAAYHCLQRNRSHPLPCSPHRDNHQAMTYGLVEHQKYTNCPRLNLTSLWSYHTPVSTTPTLTPSPKYPISCSLATPVVM